MRNISNFLENFTRISLKIIFVLFKIVLQNWKIRGLGSGRSDNRKPKTLLFGLIAIHVTAWLEDTKKIK